MQLCPLFLFLVIKNCWHSTPFSILLYIKVFMNNLIGMKMDVRHKKYTIGLYDIFILCALPSNIFIFSASFLLVSFRSSQWSFLRAPLCSWVDCTSFFSCALWISIWTWRFVQSSTGICRFLKVLLFLQQSNYFSNQIYIQAESSNLFSFIL